jgi:succinoglycan biosynthesis transport protein ExoP
MLDRPAGDIQPPPRKRRDRTPVRALHDASAAPSLPSSGEILGILQRRKLPLLASILLIPLLSYVAISQFTPRYTATGTLIYDAAEYKLRELQSIMRTDPITDAVMASQAEVLRGMPVVEQVAARLNLDANPEFNAALRPQAWWRRTARWLHGTLAPATARDAFGPRLDPVRDATLTRVQDALIVTPIKSSHVLEISFTAEDPVIAAAAVNDAMDIYVKSQLGAKAGAAARAREWLKQRSDELRKDVRQQEDAIARYRAQHGLVEGMHARLDTEQISLLTENLARAQNALAEAEGRLDAASGRAGAAAQAAIAPSVVQLRARQDQLTAELTSMQDRLGANHPDLKAVRSQLADTSRAVAAETSRVVSATAAEVRSDQERVATLQQNLDAARTEVQRDAEAQIPLNAMQRDADASRNLLQTVLERLQETSQQSAIEAPDAHEISLALPPTQPSFPRTGPIMGGSVAFGLIFGLLLVYLSELTDNTFHTSADVRAMLGRRCLALIPHLSRRSLGGIAIEDYAARKPHSAFAEQLRALRTGLSLWPDRPRTVAITAARPKEGKTTVTHALGRLAAMNGEHVVVIDCDFRHPSYGRHEPGDNSRGLVDYLRERATLGDVVQHDASSGMDHIPSGKAEANALGLLTSATMLRLLQTLRQDYDLVLLDTPPAEVIADARIVAGLADATVFCILWRGTPQHVASHALELLEEAHANVVGVALTQVDANVHVRSGYADAKVYHLHGGGFQE